MPSLLAYLLVVAAGVSVALQQVLNANLRAEIGSPWWAGVVSYVGGLLAITLAALLVDGPRLPLPSAGSTWLSWTGGLFGAIFIAVVVLMVPRFGAATVLALIVVGQMLGSLAFDHFGILGLAQQPASPLRLAGAACLILGVVLIRF
ncbi:MAG: DMT family transporter [Amaricoccus sp.]|uniref:DMT family transporter n=1 Tax=Amaricoccus sp. TaxID=1872485 RepID=UPI0039E2CB01